MEFPFTIEESDVVVGDAVRGRQKLISVKPGNYLLPAAFKETLPQIFNMEVRRDDIWVLGLPHSGIFWLAELVWKITRKRDIDELSDEEKMHRWCFLERSAYIWKSKNPKAHPAIASHPLQESEDILTSFAAPSRLLANVNALLNSHSFRESVDLVPDSHMQFWEDVSSDFDTDYAESSEDDEPDGNRLTLPSHDGGRLALSPHEGGRLTLSPHVYEDDDVLTSHSREHEGSTTSAATTATSPRRFGMSLINRLSRLRDDASTSSSQMLRHRRYSHPRSRRSSRKYSTASSSCSDANINSVAETATHGSPRLILSHLPLSLLPPSLLDTCKVVYLGRDLRECCCSLQLSGSDIGLNNPKGLKDLVRDVTSDKAILSPWPQVVLEAWRQKDHENMKFVFHHDMKMDLIKVTEEIASFLGVDLSAQYLKECVLYMNKEGIKRSSDAMKDFGIDDERDMFLLPHYLDEIMIGSSTLSLNGANEARWHQWWNWHMKNSDFAFPNTHTIRKK